jgi:hypothetical protein
MMEQVFSALGAAASFVGWQPVVFTVLGMGVYHQMLKRSPRLLSWLLSGVKSAGDAVKDTVKG